MTYHKTSFFFLIIVIIIFVLIGYTKGMVIYHPMPATKEKYHRFYKKINQLIDSPDQVTYLSIPTPDNEILDGIYVKKPDSDKCIIIFHGNTGNLSIRFDMVKFLYNYCSVIIFDYRSFGRSTGNPKKLSCTTMQKDAQSVWNHVVEKLSIKPNDISLLGESLGCSIAIKLAADLSMTHDPTKYPHSLILNSPFYSMASMVETIFDKYGIGFLGKIISYFVGNEYQSNEWIKYINHQTKIIIAHSPRDEVVPYKQGLQLYESIIPFNKNIQFINITGTHNNLGLTDQYIYGLADLFND